MTGKSRHSKAKTRSVRARAATPSTLPLLAIFGFLYIVLAGVIRKWPVTRADTQVTHALQSAHHPNIERFMSVISWFGFRPQSLLFPASAILGFWLRGRRLESVLLVVAWGSSMVSFLTKQVIKRPRPDATVVRVVVARIRDTSFPSGHVVHYVTFWGLVAYLLVFRSRTRIGKWLAGTVIAPIIALVGPSRIYLGHHWFTDVLGSYLLGSAYLAGLIEIHSLARSRDEDDQQSGDGWIAGASQWLR